MQKLFGIAVIVGLIWLGLTIFTQGTQAAFAWIPWLDAEEQTEPSPLERLRQKGEATRDIANERRERQLGKDE